MAQDHCIETAETVRRAMALMDARDYSYLVALDIVEATWTDAR